MDNLKITFVQQGDGIHPDASITEFFADPDVLQHIKAFMDGAEQGHKPKPISLWNRIKAWWTLRRFRSKALGTFKVRGSGTVGDLPTNMPESFTVEATFTPDGTLIDSKIIPTEKS